MEAKSLEFGTYSLKKNESGQTGLGLAIEKARARYEEVISTLGNIGTEVSRDRVKENDPDIFPYTYIRDGRHEFIFPPQEVKLEVDPDSGEVPGTSPYTLVVEKSQAQYDESRVTGKLVIEYDDADNGARFHVSDPLGESDLPREVLEALDTAFLPMD